MNNEQGLFDIMEIIHQWHNDKMRGIQYDQKQLRDLRLKIIEFAGLDTDKMIDLADEIDGCCFEIAQNETITKDHILQENDAIDHCSTQLRALVENIGA